MSTRTLTLWGIRKRNGDLWMAKQPELYTVKQLAEEAAEALNSETVVPVTLTWEVPDGSVS